MRACLITLLVIVVTFATSCGKHETVEKTTLGSAVLGTNLATEKGHQPTSFWGLCYGPFSGIENPAAGPYPTRVEMERDLQQISMWTKRIRIYSVAPPLDQILEIASRFGIDCLSGCWIGKENFINEVEVEALIKATRRYHLPKVVVGNEVGLRDDISEDELLALIRRVRKATGALVGTADTLEVWRKCPRLAQEVDFIIVHIYGYWDGQNIADSARYAINGYREVQSLYPDKEVILGETGWPKKGSVQGNAVPSLGNQQRYIEEFTSEAARANIPYYYFEAFDEDWKVVFEGEMGNNWGVWFLDKEANFNPPQVSHFPFVVYDEASTTNHFVPSGWMGDLEAIDIDVNCRIHPHSGRTCTKLVF